MAVVIKSIGLKGLDGFLVDVEISVLSGVSATHIVGLGDASVKESKDRIEACIDLLEYDYPPKKVVVNLSPSEIKKSGTYYDLAILIGILIETEQLIPKDIQIEEYIILGEISTTGTLKGFSGTLSMVEGAKKRGFTHIILPQECLAEASLVQAVELYAFSQITEVIAFLEKRLYRKPSERISIELNKKETHIDFLDVIGHEEIFPYITAAVAGNHNLLMVGAPGCGKSMIAKRLPTILPDMTEEEILEVTAIYSLAKKLEKNQVIQNRPYRSPHYNVSSNALIGGGTYAMPGEITLAHNGILFLDEILEFDRKALEALRQPMEDKCITISRVKHTHIYPAAFMLVGAMNPCPCGYQGMERCTCTPYEIKRYQSRLSGPILDRIGIQKYLKVVDRIAYAGQKGHTSSAELKEQVVLARKLQQKRFKDCPGINTNSQMEPIHLRTFCKLDAASQRVLQKAYEVHHFSARSYNKILMIARTFADIEGAPAIEKNHLVLGLMSRDLDK